MAYKVGDFVITDESEYPAIIIEKMDGMNLLSSIVEYKGDYIWLKAVNVEKAELKSEEKLSIVAKFDDWFYDVHILLYQELIIENIHYGN